MYFSYVPSIKFSFFNRPLFLNLLFNRFIIIIITDPPGVTEKIFPLISRLQPGMAGKITGMMLEMDNSELLMLLDKLSPRLWLAEAPTSTVPFAQLRAKVDEAMRVLSSRA